MAKKKHLFPEPSDAEKSRIQEILAKSPELVGLLARFRSESGRFASRGGYLFKEEGKRILEIVLNELRLSWYDICLVLERRHAVIERAASFHGVPKVRMPQLCPWGTRLPLAKKFYEKSHSARTKEELGALRKEMLAAVNALFPMVPVSTDAIRQKARQYPWGKKWGAATVATPSPLTQKSEESGANETEPKKDPLDDLPLEIREWDNPLVLWSDEGAWKKEGVRIGLISGIGYANPGFRAGLIELAFRHFARAGTHFNIMNGHIADRKALREKILGETDAQVIPGISKKEVRAHIGLHEIGEAAKALSALIPRIMEPKSVSEDPVRLYVMTSPNLQYDGEEGEAIAQELYALRQEDIRHYNPHIDRFPIKGKEFELETGKKFELGAINPGKKARMPSDYFSTSGEKEIKEYEGIVSQTPPGFWTVGAFAAAAFVPAGIRPRPYVMLPALRRLEEVRAAENQVGAVILEFKSPKEMSVSVFSFRDLIMDELRSIKAPRNASETQRQIVEVLKGGFDKPVGLLVEALEDERLTREAIEQEIKGLVYDEPSRFKNFPGLSFDEPSGRYRFHLPWIQERMRYKWPEALTEEKMLFFACLHAGYTTTDYEHFVTRYPQIILENGVTHLFGIGDFIAGLNHGFHESGEVFGSLNYTDQEYFAAELVATVLYKVFYARFSTVCKRISKGALLSAEAARKIVSDCLLSFVFIPGNHDLWQIYTAHDPLDIFYLHLVDLLHRHIRKALVEKEFPRVALHDLIEANITRYPDYEAVYTMPSGITVMLEHPHMGRAQTTSLRSQKALDIGEANIYAIANFHAAVIVHQWRPALGQCVAVQTGTQVIYTRFERRKMKRHVDFGPILVRTQTEGKRIFATHSQYFTTPILQKEISKFTDPRELKRELGILTRETA